MRLIRPGLCRSQRGPLPASSAVSAELFVDRLDGARTLFGPRRRVRAPLCHLVVPATSALTAVGSNHGLCLGKDVCKYGACGHALVRGLEPRSPVCGAVPRDAQRWWHAGICPARVCGCRDHLPLARGGLGLHLFAEATSGKRWFGIARLDPCGGALSVQHANVAVHAADLATHSRFRNDSRDPATPCADCVPLVEDADYATKNRDFDEWRVSANDRALDLALATPKIATHARHLCGHRVGVRTINGVGNVAWCVGHRCDGARKPQIARHASLAIEGKRLDL